MSGTIEGGLKAAAMNKMKYGENFYATIGRKGGQISRGGGFAYGEEGRRNAIFSGHKGGKISRRGKAVR